MIGFEVVFAAGGVAEVVMKWRDDLTQYSGHLHAGVIGYGLRFRGRDRGWQGYRVAFLDELPEACGRSPVRRQG